MGLFNFFMKGVGFEGRDDNKQKKQAKFRLFRGGSDLKDLFSIFCCVHEITFC